MLPSDDWQKSDHGIADMRHFHTVFGEGLNNMDTNARLKYYLKYTQMYEDNDHN
jgi:hypothetical protein